MPSRPRRARWGVSSTTGRTWLGRLSWSVRARARCRVVRGGRTLRYRSRRTCWVSLSRRGRGEREGKGVWMKDVRMSSVDVRVVRRGGEGMGLRRGEGWDGRGGEGRTRERAWASNLGLVSRRGGHQTRARVASNGDARGKREHFATRPGWCTPYYGWGAPVRIMQRSLAVFAC